MKTLADFKRALQIGSKWKTHWHPANEYWGIREVVERNSTGVSFPNPKSGKNSWLHWDGGAKEFQFDGSNTVIRLDYNGKPLLSYTLCGSE